MELNAAAKSHAELHDTFRWNVPARYNMARECCGRWAEDRARFALYYEDEAGATSAWSFWDIQTAANRLSNVLHALGVMRRDRVAILLPQRPGRCTSSSSGATASASVSRPSTCSPPTI